MFSQPHDIAIKMPDWVESFAQSYEITPDIDARMSFIISASEKNVQMKTGGPFAAGVFDADTGALIALGVNLVTSQGLSILHAEMVAITLAQIKLNSYDLGGDTEKNYELVTSTEPCAMCFGAIPWSGIRHVATGACDSDARSIGFDEGPKPNDWEGALKTRGIKVSTEIKRQSAKSVLEEYIKSSGHIYNSRES